MSDFSHIDERGNPNMVNVGDKSSTRRMARAHAIIHLPDEVVQHFEQNDMHTKKGSVMQTAILAGIMAAKKTGDLIPLCHSLPIDHCDVEIRKNDVNTFEVLATAKITGKTGVEMEALTAVSIAALTIYDMCKAFSHHIVIKEIKLLEKKGGKRDYKAE